MKPFGGFKIWMPLLGLGAALVLAPQSRAQAEVSPDHFDGTDSWEVAMAHRAQGPKGAIQAQNKKPANTAVAKAASATNGAQNQKPELVVVQDKRKIPAARKPNNR